MTQVPEGAVQHSPDGLENANANTAFGAPFTLACYFTTSNPSAGSTTLSKALCSSDAPYKFRVLRARVTMLDEANGMLREGMNSLRVHVKTASDSVCAGDVSDMLQLEERLLEMSRTGGEEVAASGSLTVACDVRLGESGATDTLSLLVELTCIRVI
jgi:hypothetical protein